MSKCPRCGLEQNEKNICPKCDYIESPTNENNKNVIKKSSMKMEDKFLLIYIILYSIGVVIWILGDFPTHSTFMGILGGSWFFISMYTSPAVGLVNLINLIKVSKNNTSSDDNSMLYIISIMIIIYGNYLTFSALSNMNCAQG